HCQPSARGLAIGHHHDDPKRLFDRNKFVGFGGRGVLAQRNPDEWRRGGDPTVRQPTAAAWFNPAAFYNTVAPEFGNCARNNLRGPKQVNIDLSLSKDFRVRESQALQFRME